MHQLPKGIGILSIAGTTSALSGQNLETRILVKPNVKQWADHFMFNLSEAEKDSGCIYMVRLRLVNRKPLFYDITYIPNINLPRFTSRSFVNKSLFDTLRRFYQIEVKGGEQKLRAISANKKIGKYLEVPAGQPILHLERKIDTNRVGFCFYSSLYCNTEDHALFGIF